MLNKINSIWPPWQCELWLPSWNFLTKFNIIFTYLMKILLISQNLGFEEQIKLSLNFHHHWYGSTYQQYDILETFFLLPRSAVLRKIIFLHLQGLRKSGLKEHISPQNKQLFLELKVSSVDRLRLATGSSTLAYFWVGGFCFKYFPMWFEDA